MATVTFRRTADVNSIPIVDGSLVFSLSDNKIYMDNGNTRLQYGGDTDLITNPADATVVNTFSATGEIAVFLQKSSVVNSKDTALAVTQNNIPLGCLAFKEALGTTDYSGVGDGTVSGALTNLNTRTNTAQTGVNDLVSQLKTGSTSFYFDYKNGQYGWNSSSARGAGTFHPFKTDTVHSVYAFVEAYANNDTHNCHATTIIYVDGVERARVQTENFWPSGGANYKSATTSTISV